MLPACIYCVLEFCAVCFVSRHLCLALLPALSPIAPNLWPWAFSFGGAVSRARDCVLLSEKPGRRRRCLPCLSSADSTLITPAPRCPAMIGLSDKDASVRERFFRAYRNDPVMLRMDAVVCSHPAAGCELFLPLGMPIILYVTTRFDLGRLHSPSALQVLHSRPSPPSHRTSTCRRDPCAKIAIHRSCGGCGCLGRTRGAL